jgi:uncharacterized protein (TIGR00299 family) protein
MRHLHLQPLGGAAGDMFVAALLDAFPEHRPAVIKTAAGLSGTACALEPHNDQVLSGSRFVVRTQHRHEHPHSHTHDHPHISWREIRLRLESSDLSDEARRHATGIFAILAEAEGRVHGVPTDSVTFHEVGATDSVADIVAAAVLIAALAPATWSVASLPLGFGTIKTAHGWMPVPAPATALLLQGFAMHDDGIGGERVTPTAAAILRYLDCHAATPPSGTMVQSGTGFGTRTMPGISNCLRVLAFQKDLLAKDSHRELAVIAFEVDDQTGEDLAMGLERVRAVSGVHDVIQMPAFGKKSRLAVHIQVLVAPDALEDAISACFHETTTIGLRTSRALGRALPRRFHNVEVEGHNVTVKLVERPGKPTSHSAKAEADHLRPVPRHAARMRLRQMAEHQALNTGSDAV